jgi:hypothetical protein
MNERLCGAKIVVVAAVIAQSVLPGSRGWLLADAVTYAISSEKISDTPIKTQIEQHVVVTGIPERQGLEAEILKRYRTAMARRGFRYHNPATNIFIYVYGTKEQAQAGQGLWIGMLAKTPFEKTEPRVQISDERLAALNRPPEARLGLSEPQRRVVFREIIAAEDRGTREATARVPDSQVMRQTELERELQSKYKADVARRHKLTNNQLREIAIEGISKGWPSK